MPRFFALGLLVLGAAMIAAGLRQAARAREARGWSRTDGQVVESRVEPVDDRASEAHLDRTRFVIRFAYEVQGRQLQSTQVWIGSSAAAASQDPSWPRRWVERFPAGAEVPVWFDPRDPTQAVLVRDLPARPLPVLLLAGGLLATIGFFVLARGWAR